MLFNILIATLLAGAVIILVLWARGAMLTPVPLCPGLDIRIELSAGDGSEETLEQTVSSLLWLVANGTLPARAITIVDAGMDRETREIAKILSRKNQIIEFHCAEEAWTETQDT